MDQQPQGTQSSEIANNPTDYFLNQPVSSSLTWTASMKEKSNSQSNPEAAVLKSSTGLKDFLFLASMIEQLDNYHKI